MRNEGILKVWRIILRNHAQGNITPPEDIEDPTGPILKLIDMGIVDCGIEGYWLSTKTILWYDCVQEMVGSHPLVEVAVAEAAFHKKIVDSADSDLGKGICDCPLCRAVRKMQIAGGQGGAAHPDKDPPATSEESS